MKELAIYLFGSSKRIEKVSAWPNFLLDSRYKNLAEERIHQNYALIAVRRRRPRASEASERERAALRRAFAGAPVFAGYGRT
jgi:hypothetical protein